jgi:hypothetical protein
MGAGGSGSGGLIGIGAGGSGSTGSGSLGFGSFGAGSAGFGSFGNGIGAGGSTSGLGGRGPGCGVLGLGIGSADLSKFKIFLNEFATSSPNLFAIPNKPVSAPYFVIYHSAAAFIKGLTPSADLNASIEGFANSPAIFKAGSAAFTTTLAGTCSNKILVSLFDTLLPEFIAFWRFSKIVIIKLGPCIILFISIVSKWAECILISFTCFKSTIVFCHSFIQVLLIPFKPFIYGIKLFILKFFDSWI